MSDPTLLAPAEGRPRSLAGDAWSDLRRNKIFWASSVLVVVILLMALLPSLFTSADPNACAIGTALWPMVQPISRMRRGCQSGRSALTQPTTACPPPSFRPPSAPPVVANKPTS